MSEILKKIRQIQRADDQIKKKWLFGATTVSMIIVVTLWIFYLNLTVPKINNDEKEAKDNVLQEKKQAVMENKTDSFANVFKNGLENIGGDIKNGLANLKTQFDDSFSSFRDKLGKKNEFLIKP